MKTRTGNKIIAFTLMLSMLLTLLPGGLVTTAEAAGGDGVFADGSGTQGDPWIIKTPEQLDRVHNYLSNTHADKYFKLGCDIDLTEYLSEGNPGYNSGAGWNPIGTTVGNQWFAGKFNGAGYKVTGLWINRSLKNTGLFGHTRYDSGSVEIKNLGVVMDDGKGGIHNAEQKTGGLVGYARSTTIENCYAVGSVTSSFPFVGGLVGTLEKSSVTNSYAAVNVTCSFASADNDGVYLYEATGGLIGDNDGSSSKNCYASGSVTSHGRIVGGLIGNSTRGSVENCYATGRVSGVDIVGGLVGWNTASITNSYFDRISTNQTNGVGKGSNAGVTGKQTNDMSGDNARSLAGFDFDNTWVAGDHSGLTTCCGSTNLYPQLKVFANSSDGYTTTMSKLSAIAVVYGTTLGADEEPFYEGTGQEGTPYLIYTAEQLNHMRKHLGAHFKLMNNISLSSFTASEGWLPVGDTGNPFTGTFDGNGKMITSLTVNRPSADTVGLFGSIGNGGVVKKLAIKGGSITGGGNAGSIAGTNKGLIEDCYNTANITGSSNESNAGGIAGRNALKITKCYNTGIISGNHFTGGIVGDNNSEIKNCYNIGSISGPIAGGIAGSNGSLEIRGCYYNKEVFTLSGVGNGIGFFDPSNAALTAAQMVQSNSLTGSMSSLGSGWSKRASASDNCYYPELTVFYDNGNLDTPQKNASEQSARVPKRDVDVSSLAATSIAYGDPLSTSTLSGAKDALYASTTVDGEYVWENASDVLQPGTHNRDVTFTPSSELYKIPAAFTMQVTVSQPVIAISIDTQPAENTPVTVGSINGSLEAAATVPGGTTSYEWFSCTDTSYTNSDSTGVTAAGFTIPDNLTEGTYYYYCRVSAPRAFSVNSNVATVTVSPVPTISIRTQPAENTPVTEGSISGSLTIDARVSDSSTPGYEWFSCSDTGYTSPLSTGMTTAAFTIPDTLTEGTYYYYCKVSATGAAAVNSTVATVIVSPAPTIRIETQPAENTPVTEGSISRSLTIDARVSDSSTPAYEWFSCSDTGYTSPLSTGVTTAAFTIPDTLTEGTYYYYCKVSATGAATVNSNVATVTVSRPVPTIMIQTQPAATAFATEGSIRVSLTIDARVSDSSTPAYEWFFCDDISYGNPVSTEVLTADFSIPDTLTEGTYYYYCRVSAAGAVAVNSNITTVTVEKAPPVLPGIIPDVSWDAEPGNIELDLNGTNTAILRINLGANGSPANVLAQKASITINGSAITVSSTQLTADGNIEITGVRLGMAEIAITFSGGNVSAGDRQYDKIITIHVTDSTPPSPAVYTVTVQNDGNGTGFALPASAREGDTVTLTATPANRDYYFSHWEVISGDVSITDHQFTMPGHEVTIKAHFNEYSSGDSDYNGPAVIIPPVVQPDQPTIGSVTGKTAGKTAQGTFTVTNRIVKSALEKAQAEARAQNRTAYGAGIKIALNTASATGLTVTLNRAALNQLVSTGTKQLELAGPFLSLTFDEQALSELQKQSTGNVIITVKPTKVKGVSNAYDITLRTVKSGKNMKITSLGSGSVTFSIPSVPGKNKAAGYFYAVYVDAKGKLNRITDSFYDTNRGSVVFSTNHFSVYGVGYKAPTAKYTDVGTHWAKESIDYVAGRGLLESTSGNTFAPDTAITREMLVTALGRLAGVDTKAYTTNSFTDIKADSASRPYIEWAYKEGIIQGIGNQQFAPGRAITREEIAVIFANFAKATGYKLPVTRTAVTFADANHVGITCKTAVTAMQQAGIMMGGSGNLFNPKASVTRAQVSAMLHRYIKLTIDPDTAQGWAKNDDGQSFYYKDGTALTGWCGIDTNGSNKTYYFHSDGHLARSTKIDGYEVDENGVRRIK